MQPMGIVFVRVERALAKTTSKKNGGFPKIMDEKARDSHIFVIFAALI